MIGRSLYQKCQDPPSPLVRLNLAAGYAWLYAVLVAVVYMGIIPKYLFLFHVLAMAAILYAFIFISKALVQAENEEGKMSTCRVCVVIMVWFFPIGIWFLQPRVNRVLK